MPATTGDIVSVSQPDLPDHPKIPQNVYPTVSSTQDTVTSRVRALDVDAHG